MEFKEIGIDKKSEWNRFLLQNSPESFLQSYEWGKFQKATGRSVFYSAAYEGDAVLVSALTVEHKLPLGFRYWYIPRGPVVALDMDEGRKREALKNFFECVKAQAQERRVVFIRMDPACEKENIELFVEYGFKHLAGSVQPKDTLVLDISKSEENLLAEMKQKTRYNIRLAEKKGVQVVAAEYDEKNFQEFWRLIGETSERDGIVSHNKAYYANMLKVLGSESGDLTARLYFAKFEGEVIAANIILFFGPYAVYLHGASSSSFRNLMAPYLLQWRQIMDAKNYGCRLYDFWGITINNENPRWEGITRFKRGFGGRDINYAGVFDMPVNGILYGMYKILRQS